MNSITYQVNKGGSRTLSKKEAEEQEKTDTKKMANITEARKKLITERNKKQTQKTEPEGSKNAS